MGLFEKDYPISLDFLHPEGDVPIRMINIVSYRMGMLRLF